MAAEEASKAVDHESKSRRGHTRVKPPLIPLDMPGRYTTGNVLAITGWSHSTLYQRIKAGLFPRPQKDGSLNFWTTVELRKTLGL